MGASIMTMTAMNLNSIIDGILMGNMLSSDAFSAINVVIPIVNCISALGILLSQGAAMQVAKHLGAMEKKRADQYFTVSLFSMLIVGLAVGGIVSLAGLTAPVVNIFCAAENLRGLAGKYISVLIMGAVLLILDNGLSMLVDVMGNPRIVTVGTIAKTGANILFDIINIKVLGMDIAGAAVATLLGALTADIVYLTYILKKSGMSISFCREWISDLVSGLLKALPGFIGTLTSVALMFICNDFVMRNQGSDGMFVMSIGYTLISIGSIISNGVGVSYTAIGAMLLGQEDYYGMRMLFRKGIIVTIISPICFTLGGLFAKYLALMFGADSPEKIELAQRSLPLVCTMLFSLGIVSSMVYLHTVLGHQIISSVNTLLLLGSIFVAFFVTQTMLPPEKIWLAFPFASGLSLIVFFIDTSVIVMRSQGRLQMVSLIPKTVQKREMLDISVGCNMEEKSSAIDKLIAFLRENNVSDKNDGIVHCLDELMMNIVSFSGRGNGAYMDLTVNLLEDKITASLRSDGKPFDPRNLPEEERNSGLKIVFHYCDKMEYRYSFGQNVLLISWMLPIEEKTNG